MHVMSVTAVCIICLGQASTLNQIYHLSFVMRKTQIFAYAKTKPQISWAVQLLLSWSAPLLLQSLFYLYPEFQASSLYRPVCTGQILQSLFYLYPEFQASSLYRPVCTGQILQSLFYLHCISRISSFYVCTGQFVLDLVRIPKDWLSQAAAHIYYTILYEFSLTV